VTLSVLRDSDTPTEVSTPTVSVRPIENGSYRLTVRPDGSTVVTVRSGEIELLTLQGSEIVGARRTMEARQAAGDPNSVILIRVSNIPDDEWDRWNASRDSELSRSDSYRYVSRDIYGADDLHRYGRWVFDSPYGWVWVPDVGPTWAPYRVGRWSWVDYYGWTWVSSDPWGWAPYHYGRWYHTSGYGWVWYPGEIAVRHHWRPALVAFFGWGSPGVRVNASLNFGFGHIGWVALAPRELYRPWYGRVRNNNVVINNVTVVNNVNIVNNYRNARFVGGRSGVTGIDTRDFGRVHVTNTNIVQVSNRDLDRAAQVRGRVPLDPSAESRRFSDRAVDAAVVVREERTDRTERAFLRADRERGVARRVENSVETPTAASGNAVEQVEQIEQNDAIVPSRDPVRTIGGRAAEPRIPGESVTPARAVTETNSGIGTSPPAIDRASPGAARRPNLEPGVGAEARTAPDIERSPSNAGVVRLPRRARGNSNETNDTSRTTPAAGPTANGPGSRASDPGSGGGRGGNPAASVPAAATVESETVDAPRRSGGPAADRAPAVNSRTTASSPAAVRRSPIPATRPAAENAPPATPQRGVDTPVGSSTESSVTPRPEVRRSPVPPTPRRSNNRPVTNDGVGAAAEPAVSRAPAPAPRPEAGRAPVAAAPQSATPPAASPRLGTTSPSPAPAVDTSRPATRGPGAVQPRLPSARAGGNDRPATGPAPAPAVRSAPSRPAPSAPEPQANGDAGGRAAPAAPAQRGAVGRARPR
jgi:hypothetical protein